MADPVTARSHTRRRAIRARQARTGEPWTVAARAHDTERAASAPADHSAPAAHAGIDWSPLHGVEVTVTPADGSSWRGVVLPPNADTAPDRLRVSPSDRSSQPPQPGELTEVDPATCVIDPMPDRVEQRFLPSRRLTRGPKGLPLYRSDNAPRLALASETTLRRRFRLQPAPDQRPVAEYYQMTDYTLLWAIADAVPMPRLSPARQAAWERNRTCARARCGKRHPDPLPESDFGPRFCPQPCCNLEARDRWDAARQRDCEQVTHWAREILASDRTLWIHSTWSFVTPFFAARIHDRHEIADLPAVCLARDENVDWYQDDLTGAARLADVEPIVEQLAGHRLIAWGRGARAIIENLRHRNVPAAAGLGFLERDVFERRYAEWLGMTRNEHQEQFYFQPPQLMLVTPPRTGRERFEDGITVLHEMAAGGPSPERRAAARARQQGDGVWLSRDAAYAEPARRATGPTPA